jgi:tetratricopeptide (TPR) repeat protein
MASFYAYAVYAKNSKLSRYFICLILFALSLMSKPMLVTLPFVLMLLDYWPLKRWQKAISSPVENRPHSVGRLIGEKIPFIFLTIASSILTFWAQNKGGSVASNILTFWAQNKGGSVASNILLFLTHLSNAVISYVAYLEKIFWPVNLAVFYPYEFSLLLWKVLISGIILILITLVVLYYIRKMPFLFVGWFWYVGTLIPVIGLVQVGAQAMADRYTYLPSIGIAVMLAWGIHSLIKSEGIRKKILFPAAIIFLAIMSILTWQQCGYWKNSIRLWNHALRSTKNNYLAYGYLACALVKEGKISGAIYHFNNAIRINPYYADNYSNRGSVYANLGQHQRAITDYNDAIRLNPTFAVAYFNRGISYGITGQYRLAIKDFNEAIRLAPDYADAYNNRAFIYLNQSDKISGCRDAKKACKLGNCTILEAAAGKGLCR